MCLLHLLSRYYVKSEIILMLYFDTRIIRLFYYVDIIENVDMKKIVHLYEFITVTTLS